MSQTVVLIAGCAIVTAIIKAAGPVMLGGRTLPVWTTAIIALLAPALLAALVMTHTFADGTEWGVGPQTAGVAAGGLVAWRWGSMLGCVAVAAVVTAALRAI